MISRTIALLALAATLAACGSSSPSPTGSPPPSSTPTASTSAATSPTASRPPASTGPSETPEPSVDTHGAPDLEALLPAMVGKVALERLSLSGKDFYAFGAPESQKRLDTFLGSLGKTLDDLRVGDAGDPTGLAVLEVGAFQVVGTQPAQLLSEWVASNQAAKPGTIIVTNTTIDGRQVTKLVDGTRQIGATTYVYAKGDTLFLVGADDPVLVSSALAQLPKP